MSYKLNAMYFSATGTTEKVVCGIAKKLWKNIGLKEGKEHINIMDFTLPQERQKTIEFSKDDILIIGVPVYAGRVPNVLTKYLANKKSLPLRYILFLSRPQRSKFYQIYN